MTLLFAFRWITKKIDGVFYELFVFLFWQWVTEVFVQGALCQNPLPQGVCRLVCVYVLPLLVVQVRFGMSPCGQIGEDQRATSALIFISLMLKWDTVLCSACLNWWDNTQATLRTHASESPPPSPCWGLWALIPIWSGQSKQSEKWWAWFYQELVCQIKSVLLLAAFISIHCLNFELANWIGSRTKGERCVGEHKTKIGRKLNWRFGFIISGGMGWALNCKLIQWGVPEWSRWEINLQ